MIPKLFKLFLLLSVFALNACKEESDFKDIENNLYLDGVLPVEFQIIEPGFDNTRASETQRPRFTEEDVIHIEATFTNEKNDFSVAYAALKLKEGKWQVFNGTLFWPYDAVKGTFKAYYFPNSDGTLQPGTSTDKVLLSNVDARLDNNVKFDLDPLKAEAIDLKYGHAVKLQFTHICSYLTFENLDPGVSDFFWLVSLQNHEGTDAIDNYQGLNNACYLQLDSENKLSLIFYKEEENCYGNQPYISGKAFPYTPQNEAASPVSKVKVSFFLEPGDYSSVELRTNNNLPYLSLKSEETNNLQANVSYIIDALKSNGITYTIEDDDLWEDDDEYEVKVKEFIEAAVKGEDYSETDNDGKEVDILEAISNGVRLLRNIRFPENQTNYDEIWGTNFSPNIGSGRVFEGDHHYIANLKQPLFQYNYGTIQNLGLKNINCEVVSKYVGQDNEYRDDRSRRGALCQWNRAGLIHNIRIENLHLKVNIESGRNIDSHSAGGICGVNEGTISDINYKGDYIIEVKNNDNQESLKVDSELMIGGITGQNVGNIFRVSPLEDSDATFSTIIIRNNCTGDGGVFSVGGAVGYCGAVMENISLPSVEVDAGNSIGYQAYTGGLVGRLRGSSNNNSVTSCTVGGSVKVGHISDYGEKQVDSYLYTGGLIGSSMSFKVSDCATTCQVNGNPTPINGNGIEANSRYATGGVFGAILTDNGNDGNEISNITGWNTNITGPDSSSGAQEAFLGTFAGLVPANKGWNDYSNAGVTVKSNANQIGASKNL